MESHIAFLELNPLGAAPNVPLAPEEMDITLAGFEMCVQMHWEFDTIFQTAK